MTLGLKGKILIGVMACALVGGVGSAVALTRSGAGGTGQTGAFDQAVYLYWGSEQTSTSIANVENLAAGVAQYRGLTVSPKSTKTVAGNVQLTFTLTTSVGEHHVKGLTVSVYKIDEAFDAGTVETQIGGKEAQPVLNEANMSGVTNGPITVNENVHETVGYYAIKVLWSGANDPEHGGYTLDATLTIAQAFSPAA